MSRRVRVCNYDVKPEKYSSISRCNCPGKFNILLSVDRQVSRSNLPLTFPPLFHDWVIQGLDKHVCSPMLDSNSQL